MKGGYYWGYLKSILTDPNAKSKYQVLCANHNWIKRSENNEQAPGGPRKHFPEP